MHKIQSFFKRASEAKLSTPTAIIIGSVIIAAGIVAYGYIVRPTGGEVTKDKNFVAAVAKEMKLKGSKWETCLASEAISKQVGDELNDGTTAGVTGTPTTFVLLRKNGIYEVSSKITGAQSEASVRAAIDQALSGKSKTEPFVGSQISDSEFISGTKSDVIVLEYADAECPFCVRFHPTILNVMDTYKDRVGYAYRHFPLSFHQNALPYAVAIECAGKLKGQEAYFGFINKLFEIQAQNY